MGGSFNLGKWKKTLDMLDHLETDTATGTTDIDISAAVYTGFIVCLTVAAPTGGLSDLVIDLD